MSGSLMMPSDDMDCTACGAGVWISGCSIRAALAVGSREGASAGSFEDTKGCSSEEGIDSNREDAEGLDTTGVENRLDPRGVSALFEDGEPKNMVPVEMLAACPCNESKLKIEGDKAEVVVSRGDCCDRLFCFC